MKYKHQAVIDEFRRKFTVFDGHQNIVKHVTYSSWVEQFLDEQLSKKEEEVRERLHMATIDVLDEWWIPPHEIERIMDYIIKYSRNPKPKNENQLGHQIYGR